MELLNQEFLGNTFKAYAVAMSAFVLGVMVLKVFKTVVIARLKKLSKTTKNKLDDVLIGAFNSIHWPFFVLTSIYISFNFINVHEKIEKVVYYIFLISVVYYAIRFASSLTEYGIDLFIRKNGDNGDTAIVKFMGGLIKFSLWVGAIILILSNMGVNVTSLVAGMGIGGIAIALALQNVLGDLFSSLSIYFDQPFKVGDFVSLSPTSRGTVKKVGLKTTRIETPQGEELVVSNSELTKSQLSNFGAMERRREVTILGVTYNTPLSKLKKIPDWIKEIVKRHGEMTEVARVNFSTFGDFSLNFEVVYYVNSKEYVDYMDIKENINFKILEKFESEGVEIAFPTQTLHVHPVKSQGEAKLI